MLHHYQSPISAVVKLINHQISMAAAATAGPAVIGKRLIIINSHNLYSDHIPIPTPCSSNNPFISAKNTQNPRLRLRLRLRPIPSTTNTNTAKPPVDEEEEEEALLLLRKSLLENQWNKHPVVTSSRSSARRRRRQRSAAHRIHRRPIIEGYVKGQQLLSHHQVLLLSKTIQDGLSLHHHTRRLAQKLGCLPSEDQLASSLKMSRTELRMKLMECNLATQKLAMSNLRLVFSIAQKYRNMGADMPDLIQGGLIGLLRGIQKYDASKGFKISTYVYWWIRQGVMRALVHNSTILRLPTHLYQRLCLIRNAKISLRHKGITASTHNVAEYLNMTQKKVRNASEASCKVISLDRPAFPSPSGLPTQTLHSYIADDRLENNPWHGVDEQALKDEVNKLMSTTLSKREAQIIRLYYGLDNECLTWEDISKRIGLSRERVRQVGLVALERLKYAARKGRLEAMLVPHSFL